MEWSDEIQRKIAEDTVKMPAAMRGVMGGPSLEDAERFLREHVKTIAVPVPVPRETPAEDWEPTRVQRYVIRIEDGAGNRRYVLAADDWSARFVPEKDSAWTFGEREDAETVAAKIRRRYPRWAVEIMGDIR